MAGVFISPQYPDVNGERYSFASLEFEFNGVPIQGPLGGPIGITSVDYEDSLEPGEVRGSPAQVISRTTGKYTASGKLTLLRYEMEQLRTALSIIGTPLGIGFKQVAFDFSVTYSGGPFGTTLVDTLHGCRIVKNGASHKNDHNVLVEPIELSVLWIDWNGNLSYGSAPGSGIPGAKFFA